MAKRPQSAEYLSIAEAAKRLTVSKVTIKRFLAKGRLTRFKIGRRTILSSREVDALVQRG